METYKIYGKYKVKTNQCELNAFPGNAEIHKYQTLAFRQGEMHRMDVRRYNPLELVFKCWMLIGWRYSLSMTSQLGHHFENEPESSRIESFS